MAPGGLACVFGVLAVVSLGIGGFFLVQGAWLVMPFALIEISALAVAFVLYARRATDGDRLWLDDGSLIVERESAGSVEQQVLPAAWVDVRLSTRGARALTVQCGRELLQVGRLASAPERERVWKEVRHALAENRRVAAS